METNEIWKEVKGYENHYWISNFGRLKTNNHYGSGRDAIMKPAKDGSGYLRTALTKNKRLVTIKMHRLVAESFIENPYNKEEVNHINGIKTDNRAVNLEWVTRQENIKHSIENNLQYVLKGEEIGTAKLTEKEVLQIRSKFIPRVYGRKKLASEYNVKPCTIKDIVLRRSWKHV